MKSLTLYEHFKNYTEEQVNQALTKLTEEDILLLKQKYGEDFKHPSPVSKKVTNKIVSILRVITKCLKDPDYIPQRRRKKPLIIEPTKEVPVSEEQLDTEVALKEQSTNSDAPLLNPDIETLLSIMTIDEVLTYTDRIETLAKLQNKGPKDILKLKKQILEMYKRSINKTIDSLEATFKEPEKTI